MYFLDQNVVPLRRINVLFVCLGVPGVLKIVVNERAGGRTREEVGRGSGDVHDWLEEGSGVTVCATLVARGAARGEERSPDEGTLGA